MHGSCLCGGVAFEVARVRGPFELCHCRRCRKVSGSAYVTWLYVETAGFRYQQGSDLVRHFAAPMIEKPPVFQVYFCGNCGSPVPNPKPEQDWFAMPAGLLDDDAGLHVDRHIYVDLKADWEHLDDTLPRFTRDEIRAYRLARSDKPD